MKEEVDANDNDHTMYDEMATTIEVNGLHGTVR